MVRGTGPALLAHGGAWDIPDDEREPHRLGALAASRLGFDQLRGGASALDTVEAVVSLLENDRAFNAGVGSTLNRGGEAVLDGSIMDGEDLRAGAVAAVSTIRNPVQVARRVLEATGQVLLAARGAEEFAEAQGFPPIRPEELVVPREVARLARYRQARRSPERPQAAPSDTVGAVALDRKGRIAVAGSTGGTLGKRPGRVGDTPLPGAGFYADSRVAGVACTGWGEGIARLALARAVLARIETGEDPAAAAAALLSVLWTRVGGTAGIVIVTPDSRLVSAWNTSRLARGWSHEGMEEPSAAA